MSKRRLPGKEKTLGQEEMKREEQIVGAGRERIQAERLFFFFNANKREEQIVGTRQKPQWIVIQGLLSHLQ